MKNLDLWKMIKEAVSAAAEAVPTVVWKRNIIIKKWRVLIKQWRVFLLIDTNWNYGMDR